MKKNYLDFWRKGLTLGGMLMFTAFSTFAYEVKVEAEDAFDFYHSGTAVKVDTPAEETTASGGSIVANMASNNAIAFELTDVPADGTYDLSIVYFGTDTNRKCYIKVNKQKKSIVQFSEKSEDTSWNGTKGNPATIVTQVYLKAGTNRIEVGAYGGYAANLDYFTATESELSIPEPKDETFCLEWDYTDEAAVTIDGVSKEEVYKAIDNNENTSLKVNADDLEMIIKIVDTASPNIAVTGALVTPGDENTGDVTSWSVQASYDDGATWESTGIGFVAAENGSVYRATLNALAATGTNLFKLVASGEGVIDIKEFQLFGVPTGKDTDTAKSSGYPKDYTEAVPEEGALIWTSSVNGIKNEEVKNLFDDNWATKFCQTGTKTMSLEFTTAESYSEPLDIKSFTMTTGYGNFERIPTEFTLYGRQYDDNGNPLAWEQINKYSFAPLPSARYTCYRFYVNIAEGKQYWDFKLDITAINGGGDIQFVQLQFLNSEQTPERFPNSGPGVGITTPVANENNTVVSAQDGVIAISAQETTVYKVYTTTGTMVAQGTVATSGNVPVQAGLYVVVTTNDSGSQTNKVLIRK